MGGSDSAKLSAMPKNFEIHLRSPECRPITSEFSDASIKDSSFATLACTRVSQLGTISTVGPAYKIHGFVQ